MAETQWEARVEEFREMVADDGRVKSFFRRMRDRHRDAFTDILAQLDAARDERVAEAEATVPLRIAELEEGSLEEEEGT